VRLTAHWRFTKRSDLDSWNLFTRFCSQTLSKRADFQSNGRSPFLFTFGGKRFDEGFRADLIVGRAVLVELKSIESLARVHKKQVLTYLKLSHLKLGLLINFGGELLKGNIERLVNELEELKL
jgi:GxxExxY protein